MFEKLEKLNDNSDPLFLNEIFSEFLSEFNLEGYVRYICENDELLHSVAMRSYSHTNGFSKIVLNENDNYKLRLHLWMPCITSYTEDIHNHRWSFSSKVLYGSYRFQVFESDVKNGLKFQKYVYKPRINEANFRLTYKGPFSLRLVETGIKQSGNMYSLGCTALHKITPLENYVATIFISSKPSEKVTSVFTNNLKPESNPYNIMSAVDLKEKLTVFLHHLHEYSNGL